MNSNFILRYALDSIRYCSIALYGSLNENGSYRPIGCGTIRRDGLVGGNMSLLEVGFEVSYAQDILSVTHNSLSISCRSIHRSQVLLQKCHVYLPT